MSTLAPFPHDEQFDRFRTRRMQGVSFVFGFADAFLVYILSSYFESASGSYNVSVFYLIAYGVIFGALFLLPKWARTLGTSSLLVVLLSLTLVCIAPLSIMPVSLLGTALIVGYLIVSTLAWVSTDIVLEGFSEDRRSGRIRGAYLTVMNLGILLAPFLATVTLSRYGFSGVFLASFLGFSVVVLSAIAAVSGVNRKLHNLRLPIDVIRNVFHRSDVLRVYGVSFAMECFYAVMIVYTTLHLRNIGLSWDGIGVAFTVMLLPFVLVQYPLGRLADRRFGEKELLLLALFLAGAATMVVPFVSGTSVFLWSVILFLTRLGIAGVEVLRDSYFFKRIDKEDGDLIAFFRTARPLANIVSAAVAGVWLLFFPLSSIFFIPAGILFLAMIPAFLLEDNLSECEVRA